MQAMVMGIRMGQHKGCPVLCVLHRLVYIVNFCARILDSVTVRQTDILRKRPHTHFY